MNKAMGTIEIDKSLETEIRRSLHQSKRATSAEHEMTTDNLGTLFRQITKLSITEVESLIGELQGLRKNLETDSDLIERAIARHADHSRGVMQLTTVIADNVKRLPNSSS